MREGASASTEGAQNLASVMARSFVSAMRETARTKTEPSSVPARMSPRASSKRAQVMRVAERDMDCSSDWKSSEMARSAAKSQSVMLFSPAATAARLWKRRSGRSCVRPGEPAKVVRKAPVAAV